MRRLAQRQFAALDAAGIGPGDAAVEHDARSMNGGSAPILLKNSVLAMQENR